VCIGIEMLLQSLDWEIPVYKIAFGNRGTFGKLENRNCLLSVRSISLNNLFTK